MLYSWTYPCPEWMESRQLESSGEKCPNPSYYHQSERSHGGLKAGCRNRRRRLRQQGRSGTRFAPAVECVVADRSGEKTESVRATTDTQIDVSKRALARRAGDFAGCYRGFLRRRHHQQDTGWPSSPVGIRVRSECSATPAKKLWTAHHSDHFPRIDGTKKQRLLRGSDEGSESIISRLSACARTGNLARALAYDFAGEGC